MLLGLPRRKHLRYSLKPKKALTLRRFDSAVGLRITNERSTGFGELGAILPTVEFATGRLWTDVPGGIRPLPDQLLPAFSPATLCLREWVEYWIEAPGADGLQVGSSLYRPVAAGLFRLQFENQLGLSVIQLMAAGRPSGDPIHVEVISRKFPKPEAHLAFFRALPDDLFVRAARLPFAFTGPTLRGVVEALQPPTPLFALHFFSRYGPAIRASTAAIQSAPHRELRDRDDLVPLAEAAEADADVLIDVLRSPERWVPARGFPLASRLQGRAPMTVRQRRPEETVDTPENRFVLACLREMLRSVDALPVQAWWKCVPADRQGAVRNVGATLREAIASSLFTEVSPMGHYPTSSRVLLQREGYRNVRELWQIFQHARRPLFAPLHHAMDLRDVASLYEVWAFLALVEEIAALLDETPVVNLRLSDERGVGWLADARFGATSHLVYNRTAQGYSGLPLRPDFTWIPSDGFPIAFDAKFRLDRSALEPDTKGLPEATAKHDDLVKMHAYRDALGVRAAVCIYPGDASVFYDPTPGRRPPMLVELLLSDATGIGAIARAPFLAL